MSFESKSAKNLPQTLSLGKYSTYIFASSAEDALENTHYFSPISSGQWFKAQQKISMSMV